MWGMQRQHKESSVKRKPLFQPTLDGLSMVVASQKKEGGE